jgi:hypothetical protein
LISDKLQTGPVVLAPLFCFLYELLKKFKPFHGMFDPRYYADTGVKKRLSTTGTGLNSTQCPVLHIRIFKQHKAAFNQKK